MNSDDDEDDDILLSNMVPKKGGRLNRGTTPKENTATRSHNMLDSLFQESTNHHQSQVRLQTMILGTPSTHQNTSVTPESTEPPPRTIDAPTPSAITGTTVPIRTERSDEALRETIQQLTQSIQQTSSSSSSFARTNKKKRKGPVHGHDDGDGDGYQDQEEDLDPEHEWHLFTEKEHRHTLIRAYEDETCPKPPVNSVPPITSSVHQRHCSDDTMLLRLRYTPVTRHSPHPSSSPLRSKPQKIQTAFPSKKQNVDIHFFTSDHDAMTYYANEILAPARAIPNNDDDDVVNLMKRFYTQTLPASLQYQMLHTIIPQYIHAHRQLQLLGHGTANGDQQQQQQQQQIAPSKNVRLPMMMMIHDIHEELYQWLLGMACSIDIWKPNTSSSSSWSMMHAASQSSIQFVLALQKYHFDHHYHWSSEETVSLRNVWDQLSNDWFHNRRTTKSSSMLDSESKGNTVADDTETMIVNVHGFVNYLLYCEGLMRYIVPSSSSVNIDAGFHIIHTLLCCSLLHSQIQPLKDIIQRLIYDLIMLLLDPVVLMSGSSTRPRSIGGANQNDHSPFSYKRSVMKAVAKVTMHDIRQSLMILDQNNDIDNGDDDPNKWLSLPYAINACIPLITLTNSTRWDHSTLYEFKATLALHTVEELVFCRGAGKINNSTSTTDGKESFEDMIKRLLTTSVTSAIDENAVSRTTKLESSKFPWMKLITASSSSSIGWFALGTAYSTVLQLLRYSSTKRNHDVNNIDATDGTQSPPQQQKWYGFDMDDAAKVLATLECVVILYQTGFLLLQSGDEDTNRHPCDTYSPDLNIIHEASSEQPMSENTPVASSSSYVTKSSVVGQREILQAKNHSIALNSTMIAMKSEFGPWKNIKFLHRYIKLFDDACTALSKSLFTKAINSHNRRADILLKYVHIDANNVKAKLLYLLDKIQKNRNGTNNHGVGVNNEENDDDSDDNDWEDIEQTRKLMTPKKKQQTKIVSFFAPTAP